MTDTRLQQVLLLGLMAGIGVLALMRPVRMPDVPPCVAAAQAQSWMVESLPWVGAKTSAKAMRAVQSGRLVDLPARARGIATEIFIWPDHIGDRGVK